MYWSSPKIEPASRNDCATCINLEMLLTWCKPPCEQNRVVSRFGQLFESRFVKKCLKLATFVYEFFVFSTKSDNFAVLTFGKHIVLEKHKHSEGLEIADCTECFVSKQIDKNWTWIIENRVAPWVKEKGSEGYWNYVNVYSQYTNVLEKGLTRSKFADLIITLCPKGFKEGKTKDQLKWNMDNKPITITLENIKDWEGDCRNGIIIGELKKLFEEPVPDYPEEEEEEEEVLQTIESRLKEYLEKRIATDPFAKIYSNKSYCGFTPTLAIEKYASPKFMEQSIPSHVIVFECVDSTLTADMVTMLSGRYVSDRKIKLVITSSKGIDKHIQCIATNRDICLMRIDPNYEVTDHCFITPRMDEFKSVSQIECDMLRGNLPMTVPLVICDVTRLTTSLTDFFRWNGMDVPTECIHAPMLTHEFIENEATKLIKEEIDYYVKSLEKISPSDKVPVCEIDPYKIAKKMGLKVIRTNLSKKRHLGNFDYRKRLVRLSNSQADGNPRDRYSMSHEIGHDVLHSNQRFREFMERDAQLAGEAATDIWERHWLDTQANYFASCLLMPRKVVALLYSIYWKKWFKREQVCPLTIADDFYNDKNFQNIVGPMSRKMKVSLEAMKNTLIEMELITIDIFDSNMTLQFG